MLAFHCFGRSIQYNACTCTICIFSDCRARPCFVGADRSLLCGGCWEEIEYTGPRCRRLHRRRSIAGRQCKASGCKPADCIRRRSHPIASGRAEPTSRRRRTCQSRLRRLERSATPSTGRRRTLSRSETRRDASGSAAPTIATSRSSDWRRQSERSCTTHGATPVSATADTAPPMPIDPPRGLAAGKQVEPGGAGARSRRRGRRRSHLVRKRPARPPNRCGTTVADLPEPVGGRVTAACIAQVLDYLFDQGQRDRPRSGEAAWTRSCGPVRSRREVEHAAGALQARLAGGRSTLRPPLRRRRRRPSCRPNLWQPLLDTFGKQAPPADVRTAVRRLHADVDQYLAERRSRSRR